MIPIVQAKPKFNPYTLARRVGKVLLYLIPALIVLVIVPLAWTNAEAWGEKTSEATTWDVISIIIMLISLIGGAGCLLIGIAWFVNNKDDLKRAYAKREAAWGKIED